MRVRALQAVCFLLLGLSAGLGGRPGAADATVRLRLVDAAHGKPRAGLVRVLRAGSDKPLALPGLFDRLRGLERSEVVAGWYVVPAGGAETTLPRTGLR